MSTRGRKPDLIVIEGGLQDMPGVPSHIPPEMHGDWLSIVTDMKERQILTDAMFGSIDSYIMALWNMRLAQKQIDTHGVLIDAGKGILKQNPAISLLGKAQSASSRLAAELGLTPAARSRKSMHGGEKHDRPGMGDLFDDLMDF